MTAGARIGAVARTAGVSVQTIRYYERLGLLPSVGRTLAGYRLYSTESLSRLRFIRQAQSLGFSLEEIKEILRVRYEGRSPCECVRRLLAAKLNQIEREMARLREFRRELHKTLARSKQLPRLPHSASAICPIIQLGSPGPKEKELRGQK